MQMLQAIALCPKCASKNLKWESGSVSCIDCGTRFERSGEFVDFVDSGSLSELEFTALEVWGDDLHAEALAAPAHFIQVEALFPDLWQSCLKGKVLEIGCGSGTDTVRLSKAHGSIALFSFDLGSNVAALSRKFSDHGNVQIFRANALHVPIQDNMMDMVYSFGLNI